MEAIVWYEEAVLFLTVICVATTRISIFHLVPSFTACKMQTFHPFDTVFLVRVPLCFLLCRYQPVQTRRITI